MGLLVLTATLCGSAMASHNHENDSLLVFSTWGVSVKSNENLDVFKSELYPPNSSTALNWNIEATSTVANLTGFLFAGSDPGGNSSNKVTRVRFSPGGDLEVHSHEEIATDFTNRFGMASATYRNYAIVSGGYSDDGFPCDDVWKCSLIECVQISNMVEHRMRHQMVTYHNELWAIGGYGSDTTEQLVDGTWQYGSFFPTELSMAGAAVINDVILLIGGDTGSSANINAYVYNGTEWDNFTVTAGGSVWAGDAKVGTTIAAKGGCIDEFYMYTVVRHSNASSGGGNFYETKNLYLGKINFESKSVNLTLLSQSEHFESAVMDRNALL